MHWSRAARTDKGVSAVGQVVSLMMVCHPPGIVDRINAQLPAQIRAYGYHRTVKGFDARKACDKRRYEYILPTWMFAPPSVDDATHAEACMLNKVETVNSPPLSLPLGDVGNSPCRAGARVDAGVDGAVNAKAETAADESMDNDDGEEEDSVGQLKFNRIPPDVPAAPDPNFIFDDECAARLTCILQQYVGTHNFHNFTVRTDPSSAQAMRYILSFECTGTFLINGKPWVRMVVLGQSFMLHQIRKMVGMALAEFTGVAPNGCLLHALKTKEKAIVPMAPDLGLFLDECLYGAYNDRWGGHHEVLSLANYADRVAAFKEEQLYPRIALRDEEEKVNATWRCSVTETNFHFKTWKMNAPPVAAQGPSGADVSGAKRVTVVHQELDFKRRRIASYDAEYSE